MTVQPMERKIIGRYIVADPKICHGKLTFRGTRIMVADILEQVASGITWDSIIEDWHGSISKEAIAEAAHLANQAFMEHIDEYVIEKVPL